MTGCDEAGSACNCLANTGPLVTPSAASGDAPTSSGGTIPAGTYHVISATYHNAPAATETQRETLEITGAGSPYTIQSVSSFGTDPERRVTTLYTTNGADGTPVYTCGSASPLPSTFSVIGGGGPGTRVEQVFGGGPGNFAVVVVWELQ